MRAKGGVGEMKVANIMKSEGAGEERGILPDCQRSNFTRTSVCVANPWARRDAGSIMPTRSAGRRGRPNPASVLAHTLVPLLLAFASDGDPPLTAAASPPVERMLDADRAPPHSRPDPHHGGKFDELLSRYTSLLDRVYPLHAMAVHMPAPETLRR